MQRIDVLARRVHWLDRYRRIIAVMCAVVGGPLLTLKFSSVVGADWPTEHLGGVGVILVVGIWWLGEVVLAGLTALWETDYHAILHDRRIPMARLLNRRS